LVDVIIAIKVLPQRHSVEAVLTKVQGIAKNWMEWGIDWVLAPKPTAKMASN